jgi:hypothetical protein
VKVPGVVDVTTEAILNPVTSKPHHARVSIREGFEYANAEFASGTVMSNGPIALSSTHRHAHLANLHLTGHGVVH